MSIVVSSAYALSAAAAVNADFPIIGYDNLVTVDTVAAGEETTDYPATNLANPSTNLLWKSGSTADQYVTCTFGLAADADYLGVARHNFGSGQVTVTVEGTQDGSTWDVLAGPQIPADDSPLLFRWDTDSFVGVRLKLEPGAVEPQAAVLYIGSLLVFERGVQPHMPLPYARARNIMTPRSQSGEFLGRIIVGGKLASTADFRYLSAAWFRANLDPFLEAAGDAPFFFAWSPQRYPTEVGFAWLTADAVPAPADLLGYVNLTLPMEGIIS